MRQENLLNRSFVYLHSYVKKKILNPVITGDGGCFPLSAQKMTQNSKTEQAITLKLVDFPK